MSGPTRSLVAAVAAVVASAGVAAAERPVLVERDVVDVSPPADVAVTRVVVDNAYGDVTVIGHDKSHVMIEALKRGPDAEALERLKVQLVPDPGGTVAVTAVLKAGTEERVLPAGAVRIDLIVRVPREAHVVAYLRKGRAEVSGVDHGVELAVDRGEVEVHAVSGAVFAETSLGDQHFEDVFGTIDARAVEGDLALKGVRGDRLDATVWKGRIDGERIRVRQLAIQLGHGDVRLALEPIAGGHYVVAAWKGDVTLRVAGKTLVKLLARTAGTIEVPRRLRNQRSGRSGELIGYLGSGASPAVLDLSSRTGTVTLAEF